MFFKLKVVCHKIYMKMLFFFHYFYNDRICSYEKLWSSWWWQKKLRSSRLSWLIAGLTSELEIIRLDYNRVYLPGSETLTSQRLLAVGAGEAFPMPGIIPVRHSALSDHLQWVIIWSFCLAAWSPTTKRSRVIIEFT